MNTINGYFLMSTMDKAVGLLTIQADNKISVVIVPNGDYFEVLCHPEVRTEIKRKLIGFTMWTSVDAPMMDNIAAIFDDYHNHHTLEEIYELLGITKDQITDQR